jgi:hypothetical protein
MNALTTETTLMLHLTHGCVPSSAEPLGYEAGVHVRRLHTLVYAQHGREPFGPELKADGLIGCPVLAEKSMAWHEVRCS